jgi:hypothetical protein
MIDPRHIAAGIVGAVDWQTDVSGFCKCPGAAQHTLKTGKKDCRVSIDGAPTIYCFHSSCAPVVAEANRRLRSALSASNWSLQLPDGQMLHSGDVLQASGIVVPRAVVVAQARAEGRSTDDAVMMASLAVLAERFKPELFELFGWPFAQIIEDSPLQVCHRDAEDQFRTWLKLWPAHSHVWIGDVYSSGRPEHATHFRPIADWYQIGPVMGNFTCGSSFKPGTFQRSNANCNGTRYLVVESDTLTKDEIGAVFAYLNRRLHFNLHAIIDTAGKSLHGWFAAPRNKRIEAQLKATLTVFGCDPKLFTYSQPVRVPGAFRDGKLQRIVWLKD